MEAGAGERIFVYAAVVGAGERTYERAHDKQDLAGSERASEWVAGEQEEETGWLINDKW